MRVQIGDTVIFLKGQRIGIVERRDGGTLTLRLPNDGNCRERFAREEVRPLAEAMCDARKRGTKFRNDLSLTGSSTLAELVEAFGYATQQLRRGSLNKVWNQLKRAGLEVTCETDRWGRDDTFELQYPRDPKKTEEVEDETQEPALQPMVLPEVFWSTALGLDSNLEVSFLRALTAAPPILCLLHMPDDSDMHVWLQGTWEGMTSWAYHAAQHFQRHGGGESSSPSVCFGPAAMLHSHLKTSALSNETPRLRDELHSLNLITLQKESDIPVDMLRLRAIWPGPVFEFKPEPSGSSDQRSADEDAILKYLFAIAGSRFESSRRISPLKTLRWSKEASSQILARASTTLGSFLSGEATRKFKGSNESATALALKADLARWIKQTHPDASLKFEDSEQVQVDEEGNEIPVNRVDLFVEGIGQFEVETMFGSGPIEAFYHQKVFSRLTTKDSYLWLVVPNEAILWAGPYLADVAHHLASRGRVAVPGSGDAYFEIQGRALQASSIDIDVPWDEIGPEPRVVGPHPAETVEAPLRLSDIAGYSEIRRRVDDLIIWPEKHRSLIRKPSRSSGILFFGPPGCGKSRLAGAIAGELEQEVRLLSPSDLRGVYIGWGQIMIREQFDWVAEHQNRMLVIDELDAVARSRRMDAGGIHSDEMANVNELLVQLDRVSRLGRLVVGTTNFIGSLDDAVIRSGRFGRFIPVPPPDIDQAVAIVDYYLRRLEVDIDHSKQPRVEIPSPEDVRLILDPLVAGNRDNENWFCGADLEEAVNRTYLRCSRETLSGVKLSGGHSEVTVCLTKPELERSLMSVPRSVRADAMRQFREDEAQYCGGAGLTEMF
ncbi:MAG: ATP-binding protein [Planctomycetaceae bacterium]